MSGRLTESGERATTSALRNSADKDGRESSGELKVKKKVTLHESAYTESITLTTADDDDEEQPQGLADGSRNADDSTAKSAISISIHIPDVITKVVADAEGQSPAAEESVKRPLPEPTASEGAPGANATSGETDGGEVALQTSPLSRAALGKAQAALGVGGGRGGGRRR